MGTEGCSISKRLDTERENAQNYCGISEIT
jgi:hypothetical protein